MTMHARSPDLRWLREAAIVYIVLEPEPSPSYEVKAE